MVSGSVDETHMPGPGRSCLGHVSFHQSARDPPEKKLGRAVQGPRKKPETHTHTHLSRACNRDPNSWEKEIKEGLTPKEFPSETTSSGMKFSGLISRCRMPGIRGCADTVWWIRKPRSQRRVGLQEEDETRKHISTHQPEVLKQNYASLRSDHGGVERASRAFRWVGPEMSSNWAPGPSPQKVGSHLPGTHPKRRQN